MGLYHTAAEIASLASTLARGCQLLGPVRTRVPSRTTLLGVVKHAIFVEKVWSTRPARAARAPKSGSLRYQTSHSNAGAYVPALTGQRRVVGCVFVDALLPSRAGRVPLAPLAFLDVLRDLADDVGLLPPWTCWWDEADVAGLLPAPRRVRSWDGSSSGFRFPTSRIRYRSRSAGTSGLSVTSPSAPPTTLTATRPSGEDGRHSAGARSGARRPSPQAVPRSRR